jgi:protein-tyrosine phosphatase
MIGVKLAPEVQAEAQYHLPIRDFSIPPVKLATDRLVFDVLTLLAVNMEPVYVGCMGGRGRTGMFLALLAKTMGVENPIPYVRTFYWQEAIETRIQEKYIDQYVTPLSRWQHWRLKGTAYWYGED